MFICYRLFQHRNRTKAVRVFRQNHHPIYREKGSCHKIPKVPDDLRRSLDKQLLTKTPIHLELYMHYISLSGQLYASRRHYAQRKMRRELSRASPPQKSLQNCNVLERLLKASLYILVEQ